MPTNGKPTVVTSKALWIREAPGFNFELDQDQLLAEALLRGYVTKVGDDQYQINPNYTPIEGEA